MPLWGREDEANSAPKFTVDVYGNSGIEQFGNTVFLVDVDEARVKGVIPGWVRKIDRGNGRVYYETLVAINSMSGPDADDDAEFPDVSVNITSQPDDFTANTGSPATFAFNYDVVPTDATISIVWQESTDEGNTFSDLTADAIYTNVDTDTLTITDVTGFDANQYRAVVSANGMNDVITDVATLTVV